MKKRFWLALLVVSSINMGLAQTDEQSTTSQQEVEVKLFPNPATNLINILGLKNSEKATILVSDTFGNVALRYEWKIKNKVINLPVAQLEKGLYLLNIWSPEQNINLKFYKQ